MKKQLLAVALTVGMLTVSTAQCDAVYYEEEGGVAKIAKAPFRAAGDVVEGTGDILTGNAVSPRRYYADDEVVVTERRARRPVRRTSRRYDDGYYANRYYDEGGVEKVVKAPVRAAGDVLEGTGDILTGNW